MRWIVWFLGIFWELPKTPEDQSSAKAAASPELLRISAPVLAEHPRSTHWPTVRKRFLEENPVCAACGGTEMLEVHHITPFHVDPSREEDVANLVTLCEKPGHSCHHTWGHGYDWKKWNPNVLSDVNWWRQHRQQFREGGGE